MRDIIKNYINGIKEMYRKEGLLKTVAIQLFYLFIFGVAVYVFLWGLPWAVGSALGTGYIDGLITLMIYPYGFHAYLYFTNKM